MDKFEYKIRADEIKELISRGEYAQAAEIADTIDWRRVKSVMMLCTISDLYKINRRYEDARDMLLLAYERRPGGRTICYSLCELSIKMEEFVQAVEYYKEFVQVAPKDPGRYILQYKLYEAQEVSLEERIAVLEELKKRDYREKWAYELAYLYHRVGLASRCVEECDELILWFGEGKYVIKAMELKMLHQPLSEEQQARYENRFAAPVEEPVKETAVEEHSYSATMAEAPAYEATDTNLMPDEMQGMVQQMTESMSDDMEQAMETSGYVSVGQPEKTVADVVTVETTAKPEEDEMEIHVKTMDMGQYNTINLQAELAEGLKEVLKDDAITRSIMAPMLDTDTESLDYPEIDEVNEDDLEDTHEEMEASEVFFGETTDMEEVQQEIILPEEQEQAETEIAKLLPGEATATEQSVAEETPATEEAKTVPDVTAELVMQQLREEITQEAKAEPEPVLHVEPPKALAGVLSQESDGQISLVMPERENIEKQITGQMSIDDILAEWERIKKINQEKREAELRQHVLQQTGSMFTEFEAAVRDGLLEQLEREKLDEEAEVTEETESVEEAEAVEETESIEETEALAETEVVADAESDEQEDTELEAAEAIEEAESVETTEAVREMETVEVTEAPIMETEAAAQDEVLTEFDEVEELEEISKEQELETEDAVREDPTEDAVTEAQPEAEAEPDTVADENDTAEELVEEEDIAEEQPDLPAEVVRDKAKVRPLTREEKELFGPYIQSRSAKEQLVKCIDSISLAAYTGNVIITGAEGMDTLTLAKNIIRDVQNADSNFSGKVAKISGAALNNKDVAETTNRLKNGALIISKASEMNKDTANALYKILQQESLGIIIVLEDIKKAMDKFLAENEKLVSSFTARMDVMPLSNDTLVAFGKQYAREREYSIDDLGVLALHTRIEELQTIDHVVTVLEVKDIVEEAIRHVKRKTLGHFFDVLLAKRYDDEDMIILTEKDFV